MIEVGLTGGIGSGKTTVAKMFEDLGVPVFIADKEAKYILDQADIAKKVAVRFDLQLNSKGKIHKPDLAAIVFNDKKALEQLNSIIHPQVYKRYTTWLQNQEANYIIYEAAIIFEKGRASEFDYTILVTAPIEERIRRVMERDQVNREDVVKRMNAQWPEAKKEKLASFSILNTNLEETFQKVRELNEYFIGISDK